MLPKRHRLRAADFKQFRGAKVLHTAHFLIRVKTGGSRTGAAVVVSAAAAKKAVTRNLLRRRVYALLEKSIAAKEGTGFLLTITAKKGADQLAYGELLRELRAPIYRSLLS